MDTTLEDLMVTIHPHPTLSEAIMEAQEVEQERPARKPFSEFIYHNAYRPEQERPDN